MADGAAHEDEQPVDQIGVGRAGVGDGLMNFISQRGRDSLVGVENENPLSGEGKIIQAPVLLLGVVGEGMLDDSRARIARQLLGAVGAAGVEDEDVAELRALATVSAMWAASLRVGIITSMAALAGAVSAGSARSEETSASVFSFHGLAISRILMAIQYSYVAIITE